MLRAMADTKTVRVYESTLAYDANGRPVRSAGELRHTFSVAEDQPDVARRTIKARVLALTKLSCSVSHCADGSYSATVTKELKAAPVGRRA